MDSDEISSGHSSTHLNRYLLLNSNVGDDVAEPASHHTFDVMSVCLCNYVSVVHAFLCFLNLNKIPFKVVDRECGRLKLPKVLLPFLTCTYFCFA